MKEQRSCRGNCGTALFVKPGSRNPHNSWCPWCCPLCAKQAAEAPARFATPDRAYGRFR